MVQLDLQNSSLWEETYSTSVVADRLPTRKIIPIPEITVPILFEKPIIAVRVTSLTANITFKSCGWLAKRIATGVTVGNNLNNRFDYSRRLFLDAPSVIDWKNFGESYKLTFQPYSKFDQITLRIWQYIGDIPEFNAQQFEALRIDVLRLEKKVELLVNRDIPLEYTVKFDD